MTAVCLLSLVNLVRSAPPATPRLVAVLSTGIAWAEGDTIRCLSWPQIRAARVQSSFVKGNFLVVETEFGRAVLWGRRDVGAR